MNKDAVYIAGPMRGYARFNFDAFDAAEADLKARGYTVITPANLDRHVGFDPEKSTLKDFDMEAAVRRDVEGIISADLVALLPGWQRSVGATAEKAVAGWLGKPCVLYPSMKPVESINVLHEAHRLVHGDRNGQYGPPSEDFDCAARMLSAWLSRKIGKDVELAATDIPAIQILIKMSRLAHGYKGDSVVDLAGYAECWAWVHEGDGYEVANTKLNGA